VKDGIPAICSKFAIDLRREEILRIAPPLFIMEVSSVMSSCKGTAADEGWILGAKETEASSAAGISRACSSYNHFEAPAVFVRLAHKREKNWRHSMNCVRSAAEIGV
jgi:hypothetical protein